MSMSSEIENYPESFVKFRSERLSVNLSPQQCEAVCSIKGPVLLLAVPGSGKTTVLISRLGYMIYELGIDPESILTMTYTVAATGDMKRRFVKYFGNEYEDRVEFRTINGVCSKIVSYYGKVENRKVFELCEEGKSRHIVLEILKNKLSEYPTDNDVQEACTKIAYAKNMMLTEEKIAEIKCSDIPFGEIYSEYRSKLKENSLMDYDDQLVYALEILKKYPDILDHYRKTFKYICVDEAQDTSKIQHEIISLLAGKTGNLFMVGDEDQSIYGFRAAYPEALMTFGTDHPGARILVMDMNFRSDANVVAAADGFVRSNIRRYDKKMRPSRAAKNKIVSIEVKDRNEQFDYLYKTALSCNTKTAVLYRDNDSAIPLADRLDRSNTDFNIRTGDYGFFTHKIIRDIRNIISFAYNPFDTDLFMQIYNRFQLYLKKQDAVKICEISRNKNISVPSALLSLKTLGENMRSVCASFCTNLRRIPDDSASNALKRILSDMNYSQYLRRNNMSIGKVHILLLIAKREKSAESLIKRLDYLEGMLKDKQYSPDCNFIMSTVHSAKGLEYPTVFLADVADGVFPSDVPTDEDKAAAIEEIKQKGRNAEYLPIYDRTLKNFEEERRLFYVAVTRAIDYLYVFQFKDLYSTFCKELFDAGKSKSSDSIGNTVQTAYDSFEKQIVPSLKVRHKLFGPGIVTERNDGNVCILFADGQKRMFSLKMMYENGLLTVLIQ